MINSYSERFCRRKNRRDRQPADGEASASEHLLLPTEVFLAEADGTFWVHRRGAYSVKRPIADITRHRDGIPFLAPEVVLLFKARSKADKDQHDVETALAVLDAGQRSWLQESLDHLPQGRKAAVPGR